MRRGPNFLSFLRESTQPVPSSAVTTSTDRLATPRMIFARGLRNSRAVLARWRTLCWMILSIAASIFQIPTTRPERLRSSKVAKPEMDLPHLFPHGQAELHDRSLECRCQPYIHGVPWWGCGVIHRDLIDQVVAEEVAHMPDHVPWEWTR